MYLKRVRFELRLPKRFPEKQVAIFLNENQNWIRKKLAEVRELQRPKKKFISGEELFVLGYPTTLCLTGSAKKVLYAKEALWAPEVDPEQIKKLMLKWYREKAKEVSPGV